jgi:hypothetical protein
MRVQEGQVSNAGHGIQNAVYLRDYALRVSMIEKVYATLASGKTCPECHYNPGDRTLMVPEWVAHLLEHELDRARNVVVDGVQALLPEPPRAKKGPTI